MINSNTTIPAAAMATIASSGLAIGTPEALVHQDAHQRDQLRDLTELPAGFPKALACSFAWTGTQFADESQYVYSFDESEIQELGEALKSFRGTC